MARGANTCNGSGYRGNFSPGAAASMIALECKSSQVLSLEMHNLLEL